MSFCAPKRQNKDWTCFNIDELESMALAWNHTRLGKQNPISLPPPSNDSESRKQELWKNLRNRFQPFCGDNEACWLDSIELGKVLKTMSPEMYKIINFFTLKPKGTKGKQDWLSTSEIDYVMQQYEEIFPNFKYIGCFPSDYYKLSPSKFPRGVLDKYTKSGIVFNLDESHQNGSHWVAVFFDRDASGQLYVEYFDPTGDTANKNINQFFNNPYFDDAVFLENKYKHQKGDNECGMYSMYFILQRLNGYTFDDLQTKRIPDKSMNDFRSFVFRPFSETFSMERG